MLFQDAAVLGLLVGTALAQGPRGQRHRRQASYGGVNSTSTAWNYTTTSTTSSSSTSSSSSISSTSLVAYSSSEATTSTPASYSSPLATSSNTTSLAVYTSGASASTVLTGYSTPSTSTGSSTSLVVYPSGNSSSSVATLTSSTSATSSITTRSSTVNTSESSASHYSGPLVSPTTTSVISTYVTISTPVPSPSPYSGPSFHYSPGVSGPSFYGPSPVGPGTAGSSSPGSSLYGSSGGIPVTENATTVANGPTGTGYSAASTSSSVSTSASNATCSGATLNVLGASLDWWYTETYTYVASTFEIEFNLNDSATGWTLLPASTTFDVSSAVAQPSCTSTIAYVTYVDSTDKNTSTYSYYDYVCSSTPTPVAAATTVISQTAYTTINATTGLGAVPNLAVTPAPAAVTIPSSGGDFSAGTPFVYFSAYEVMSKYPTTFANGSAGCAETTSIYNMSSPFSFEYTGEDVNGVLEVGADVTGDVNPAFLGIVSESAAVAGSWVAAPTVVVVVEKVVAAVGVLAAHTETSATELDTPTPTLPSFLSTIGPTTDATVSPIAVTEHVESTESFLEVPTPITTTTAAQTTPHTAEAVGGAFTSVRTFIAHLESSITTLILPTPTNAEAITTDIGGQEVTATALAAESPSATGGTGNGSSAEAGGSSDASSTIVPFVASVGSSAITINVAVNPTQTVVTANFQGATVTGTALSIVQSDQPAASPGLGNLISAVVSVATPTNAAQVLSQAETAAGSNPTVAAIVSALGGSNSQGGGGGEPASASGSSSGSGSSGSSGSNGGSDSGSGSDGGSSSSGDSGTSASDSSGSSNAGSSSDSGSGSSGSNSGSDSGSSGSSGTNNDGTVGSSGGSSPQPAATPVLTVAGSTITANPTPAFVVDGQTALPGGSPITVGSDTIAVPASTNAIVIDGSTIPLAGAISSSTVLDINGVSITANPEAAFPIGSQTLQAGGSAITVDGTRISLAPGATAVVIGSSTSQISQETPGAAANIPLITVGSQTFTANAATQFSLGPGATLTPGGVVTVSGSTISLASGATRVVINGQTESLGAAVITPAPLVTFGGTVYQPNGGSTYDVAGSLLTPGGVITVSGSTISLASDASAIVVNGITMTLSQAGSSALPLVIGGTVYQPTGGSTYNVAGSTLTPGGVITVSGSTISLASDASAIVVNGITTTLSQAGSSALPLIIGGTVYQPTGGSTYDVAGSTLTPGGVITVSGTTISLASDASSVVINGVTRTLSGAGSSTPMSNYATITAPPVITVDGQAFGANGGTTYIISGQTLTPGGAITITESSGEVETVSLNSAANELISVVSGTTMSSMIGAVGAMATGAPILTIDGQQFSAVSYDSSSGPTYVVGGQTLTRGGEITISGSDGLETISLDSAGTAIVDISNGHTTTSTISGAYGVMPTAAPVLTIDGETFTAIGNGATYVIDGKTLTPGDIETVTISGHTFVISLAPQATLLMIEEEGPNGQITAVSYETLFPAQMTRGTVTNTLGVQAQATAGASLSAASASSTGGADGPAASLQNAGTSLGFQISGLVVAFGSLALAVWL